MRQAGSGGFGFRLRILPTQKRCGPGISHRAFESLTLARGEMSRLRSRDDRRADDDAHDYVLAGVTAGSPIGCRPARGHRAVLLALAFAAARARRAARGTWQWLRPRVLGALP